MRPSFLPRLINSPFDDPGLYIPISFSTRSLLMDLGDIRTLPPKDILKITHVFVTHTHMDHFSGFDRLLRLFLGRDKQLFIFGPEGFLNNIEGKLSGYTWNLVKHYQNQFAIFAHEILPDRIMANQYICRHGFTPAGKPVHLPFNKLIVKEPAFTVTFEILDHGIPCLAYVVKEHFHINVKKNIIEKMNLPVGPWIGELKRRLYRDPDANDVITVPGHPSGTSGRTFRIKELAQEITTVTPGQKIAYVTDIGYTEQNRRSIVNAAKDVDHLYIEAAFMEKHKAIAGAKYHLTARQAGKIAAMARAKQFSLFHFSPRYLGMERAIQEEALTAYKKQTLSLNPSAGNSHAV